MVLGAQNGLHSHKVACCLDKKKADGEKQVTKGCRWTSFQSKDFFGLHARMPSLNKGGCLLHTMCQVQQKTVLLLEQCMCGPIMMQLPKKRTLYSLLLDSSCMSSFNAHIWLVDHA